MSDCEWAPDFFRRISVVRVCGSPALGEVQRLIIDRLEQLGYTVHQETFVTSPRRLIAASLAGAGLGGAALFIAPIMLLDVAGWSISLAGFAALTFIAVLASGVANGHLPLAVRAVHGRNIWASRGEPRVWLVAHSDSKGQGVSLAGRVVGGGAMGIGLVMLATALLLRSSVVPPWWVIFAAAFLTALGGAALSRGPLKHTSPGAVDNATGVIGVLVAADQLRDREDVGVLVTDAEEFGMEGARAWCAVRDGGGLFVNFDGLDSRGRYHVTDHTSSRSVSDRAAYDKLKSTLIAELRQPATGSRQPAVGRSPLPLGVFVDGSVLARAGMTGFTLSRGDWNTLRVVHTRHDTVERVDVAAAVAGGRCAARAITKHFG